MTVVVSINDADLEAFKDESAIGTEGLSDGEEG